MCEHEAPLAYDPPKHLLIVDDEPKIRMPIARALTSLGYLVEQAGSGQEAIDRLQQSTFDLMLLDIQMPGLDGVEVMQQVRQANPEMLIMILTGHPTLDNAISSIKLDVADYVRKPASVNTIANTVAAVLKKNAERLQHKRLMRMMTEALHTLEKMEEAAPGLPVTMPEHVIYVSPIILDKEKLQASREDKPNGVIELTEGEAAVLAILMTSPNQIFSCRQLVKRMFNYDTDECNAQSIIRPYIFRLRQKIEKTPGEPELIQTVRGRGYTFNTTAAGLTAAA